MNHASGTDFFLYELPARTLRELLHLIEHIDFSPLVQFDVRAEYLIAVTSKRYNFTSLCISLGFADWFVLHSYCLLVFPLSSASLSLCGQSCRSLSSTVNQDLPRSLSGTLKALRVL